MSGAPPPSLPVSLSLSCQFCLASAPVCLLLCACFLRSLTLATRASSLWHWCAHTPCPSLVLLSFLSLLLFVSVPPEQLPSASPAPSVLFPFVQLPFSLSPGLTLFCILLYFLFSVLLLLLCDPEFFPPISSPFCPRDDNSHPPPLQINPFFFWCLRAPGP